MLNLHFRAIFQAKACILKKKGLSFAHFLYQFTLITY